MAAPRWSSEATADLTGKVMQVGSRMIEGVSKQLFQQFAKRLRKKLEGQGTAAVDAVTAGSPTSGQAPPEAAPTAHTAAPAPEVAEEEEALSVVPLVLRAIWDAIKGFFRSIFGGGR